MENLKRVGGIDATLPALQFGHGIIAVENCSRGRRCGRWRSCFNLATASSPWRTTMTSTSSACSAELQFGHGIIAVENPAERECGRPGRRCFNLATASSPWRTGGPEAVREVARRLQFGHGIIAVENRAGRPSSGWRRRCFNLATASSPWRTPGPPGTCRPTSRRFNLATASSPWRTARGRWNHPAVDRASIWPRHHRRGELLEPNSLLTQITQLQFGHGIIAVENSTSRA